MLEGALRGLTAASVWAARRARSLRARVGASRGRAAGPGPGGATQPPRPEDAAFLTEVSETLRRIETPGGPAVAPAPAAGRLKAARASLRRLREAIRRHEDVLLAAALLAGILAMVVHWRMSTGRPPAQAPRGARSAEVQPAMPAEGEPGVRAGSVEAAGDSGRLGLPR
jgi:hypothetical protein